MTNGEGWRPCMGAREVQQEAGGGGGRGVASQEEGKMGEGAEEAG